MITSIIRNNTINNINNKKECAVMQGNLYLMDKTNSQLNGWRGGRQGDLNEQGDGWHGGRQGDLNEQGDGWHGGKQPTKERCISCPNRPNCWPDGGPPKEALSEPLLDWDCPYCGEWV